MYKYIVFTLAFVFGLMFAVSLFFLPYKSTTVTSAKTIQKIEKPTWGTILFVSDTSGNQEIYKMDLQTKEMKNLSNNPANDMNPQVSPDKKFIVFYSDRDGDNEIYRMELENGEVTQLTANKSQDYDPSYSPDGKYIVYKADSDDQQGDIFLMKADGSEPENITVAQSTTEEWDPGFSSDGKSIVFTVRKYKDDMTDELYLLNLADRKVTQLTRNIVPDWYPSTHPQNNLLLFISRTDRKNPDDIYKSTITGTNRVQLTALPGNDADPAWDITGKKIIFINDQDKDYDLYIMNADGSNIEKILDTKANELSPIFLSE